MRRFAAWLLICCFLLWGPLDCLPLALAAPPRSAKVAVHELSCRCAACPGGVRCCCKPTSTPARAAFLKARCEEPHTANIVSHAAHPIAFFTNPVRICIAFGLPLTFAHADAMRVLPLLPPDPPPCRA